MYTLASRGGDHSPWGIPRFCFRPPVRRQRPECSRSSTGDFSHSFTRRRTFPSAIRRATDFKRSPEGDLFEVVHDVRIDDVVLTVAHPLAHFA